VPLSIFERGERNVPAKVFLPKLFVPFFLFLSQQPLFGAEPHGAVQVEPASPSENDSDVQSGAATSRRENAALFENTADPNGERYSGYVVWQRCSSKMLIRLS
jgi:hypothetical protein